MMFHPTYKYWQRRQRLINWLKFWGVPLLKCALLFIIVYFVAVDALTADWSE